MLEEKLQALIRKEGQAKKKMGNDEKEVSFFF